MGSIAVRDEAHWHELRAQHVGGSEVAALFGMSPYGLTRWQLYMQKTGKLPHVDLSGNSQVSRGKHYEPAIAAYAQEKFGIQLRKVRRYLTLDSVNGFGASLDYEMYGGGALIPTEIKLSNFSGDWDWEGDDVTEVPEGIMLQAQHQIAAADAPSGQIIADVGYDVRRMLVPRNERLITAIKAAVWQFWQDVAARKEPPVDFSADAEAINKLAYMSKLRALVVPPDQAPLFKRWHDAADAEAKAKDAKESARAEVLKLVVDAGEGNDVGVKVTCADWRVSISKIADSLGKDVTQDMVGTKIGARKGHLRAALKNTQENNDG